MHILGGGAGQLSAIRRCRELGITTIVTDMNPEAPGCLLADYSGAASTFEPGETISAVREFQGGTGMLVDAMLVTGTDQPVLTAAITGEELGIPYFLDAGRAALVTNKEAMKKKLAEAQIPAAPCRFIAPGYIDSELEGLHFPVVVKPLDSQGQRGVYRLNSATEIRERIDEVLGYSRCESILVEEYYPSDEITLSGWMEQGQLHILSVTDRVTIENPPSIGVCIAHHYPSKYSSRLPEIRSLTERLTTAFGLTDGPIYFQYLVGPGSAAEPGGIIVNEAACRLGGAYEDEFLPFITGIDILDVMIRFSCRLESPAAGFNNLRALEEAATAGDAGRVVSLQMFFCEEGVIDGQYGMDEVLALPGVTGGGFLLATGTRVRNRLNSGQRAGYFIVCCGTEAEADVTVSKAYELLRIEDESGHNMIQFHDKMLFGGNR